MAELAGMAVTGLKDVLKNQQSTVTQRCFGESDFTSCNDIE